MADGQWRAEARHVTAERVVAAGMGHEAVWEVLAAGTSRRATGLPAPPKLGVYRV